MKFEEQLKIVKKSKQVHGSWYKEQYPDVKIVAMDPAEHYLKYGAAMGRNPGKFFDTKFYESEYPDVKESGLNPLVHFVQFGEREGRKKKPPTPEQLRSQASKEINVLRRKLYTLGFSDAALEEIRSLADANNGTLVNALAAKEMAHWYIREGTEEGHEKCLEYIASARSCQLTADLAAQLSVIEILCFFGLERIDDMHAAYEAAVAGGYCTPDVTLVYSNAFSDESQKMRVINDALSHYGISEITLNSDKELMPYDRLRAVKHPEEIWNSDAKVSVLIAAFNSEDTIATTLRCLQEQSWKNLEIIVIDDCSTDGTCDVVERFADNDPRVKLLKQTHNAGAYVARNRGLDESTGRFVTIHDADDWSHPDKIATQVQHLLGNEGVMGCTSQQARISTLLNFTRLTGAGQFIITNTSSFMFRREPVKEKLGYWDTVRFSADNELIRRIQKTFGDDSICHIKTGPLSFQRDSDTSIVAHEHFGIQGAIFGIRQEYLEAQNHFHENASSLKYSNEPHLRAFPVPQPMLHAKAPDEAMRDHFDVIIVSEFRMMGGSVKSNIEEIRAHKRAGLKTGLIQLYRYDLGSKPDFVMLPEVRSEIDGDLVQVISYGQSVSCDLLLFRYPPILQHRQKFFPDVKASEVKVIVNQPPMSDYTESGVLRYTLESCAENIRHYTGKDAVWYPIGPLVRDTLIEKHSEELHHIELAQEDWSNIIDIDGWHRGKRLRGPNDVLRIGRHSRDNHVKWPASREDILAAYPARDDVEVHILGGANAASALIGGIPKNWSVQEFGSVHPKEFLAQIDVFIYFSHPDWVESFGRTIIEAMAVGVPVILPDEYRPLFKEAAIYTTPDKALDLAMALHRDASAYERQVSIAMDYVHSNFSYEKHGARLERVVPLVR